MTYNLKAVTVTRLLIPKTPCTQSCLLNTFLSSYCNGSLSLSGLQAWCSVMFLCYFKCSKLSYHLKHCREKLKFLGWLNGRCYHKLWYFRFKIRPWLNGQLGLMTRTYGISITFSGSKGRPNHYISSHKCLALQVQ